jgi:hypothetical protein
MKGECVGQGKSSWSILILILALTALPDRRETVQMKKRPLRRIRGDPACRGRRRKKGSPMTRLWRKSSRRRDEEIIRKLVTISYIRTNVARASSRPVVFAFKGGPGSASIWTNFGGLGLAAYCFKIREAMRRPSENRPSVFTAESRKPPGRGGSCLHRSAGNGIQPRPRREQ